jgi:hypothetical protein
VTTYQQIIARGRAEGKAEGKAELLLRMLVFRFGPVAAPLVERVHAAAPSTLEEWAERVITAESVDDVLR